MCCKWSGWKVQWSQTFLFLFCLPAVQANLIRNGDFQFAPDGSYNASPYARFWASWGETGREDWTSVGNDQYAATVRNFGGANPVGGWYQDVPGTPGARYILTCQLNASPDLQWSDMDLKLEFYDGSYQMLSAVTNHPQGVGIGGWTIHEVKGAAPAQTVWVRAVFAALGLSVTGSVSADDFKLDRGPFPRPGRAFNLLENGGFQLAPDHSTSTNAGSRSWTRWGDATRENWFSFDGDGFLASIHNWNSTAGDGGWFQDLPAEPGKRYRLNGFFQKEACYSADALQLKMEFLDSYGDPLAVHTNDLTGAHEWWTDYHLWGDAPTGTVWLRCTVLAENQNTCGALKLDGLRVMESPIPIADLPELLANAGFTNGLQNWITWGGPTNVNWDAHDGDGTMGALQNFSGSQADGGLYQDEPASVDEKFHASGWFKAESWYSYWNLFFILEFRDGVGNLLGNQAARLNGVSTNWTYYEVEGRAPVGAATVRTLITAQGQGNSGYFYFDDLRLVKVPPRDLQRLEPEYGAYTAANPDMGFEEFNRVLDWDHAGNGLFLSIPNDYHAAMDWAAELSLRNGAIFMVTLSHYGAERVGDLTPGMAEDVADWCQYWNDRGLPIFVRYNHEMNGDWYAQWGMQPQRLRKAWRILAQAIYAKAPLTAMVWAPYLGVAYPFDHQWKNVWDYIYDPNLQGSVADFTLLDTDGNGYINSGDDPYGPYYPGDEYVDWVGVSIYHWATTHPFYFNTYPWARFLATELTAEHFGQGQLDFYFRYCQIGGKPLMLAETAAMFKTSMPPNWWNYPQYSNDEAFNKSRWIEQLYNVLGDTANADDVANHFPKMKAVYYFSIHKYEGEADGPTAEYGGDVDWTITSNPDVRSAYRYHVSAMKNQRRYWLRAGDLKGCAYTWNSGLEDWEPTPGAPFQVSVTNDGPVFEGPAALRLDYDGSLRSEDYTAVGNYNAMKDAIGWQDFDAIYLRVRVPPPEPVNPVRVFLIMESAESGWDVLATNTCPADGAWHTLNFPYDWSRHDGSPWLKFHLRMELPFGETKTVYLDALEAALDIDGDGWPDEVDPDDDNDGITDLWELDHVLDPYQPGDAAVDEDSDGFSNQDEFLADTDPQDSGSRLEVGIEELVSDPVNLVWDGRKKVKYQVQQAGSPAGPWLNLGMPLLLTENAPAILPIAAEQTTNQLFRLQVVAP